MIRTSVTMEGLDWNNAYPEPNYELHHECLTEISPFAVIHPI